MDRAGHVIDHPRGRSVWRAQERHNSRAGATYARFLAALEREGEYSSEHAETYAIAVIATLEERLPFSAVYNFEAQLPSILHDALEQEPILDLPAMDKRLFLQRVAMRLGTSPIAAEAIAKVVFTVLRNCISAGESRRIENQLSPDLQDLWIGESSSSLMDGH